MGKLVPGVGAVIGGSLDLVETKAIGDRTYKWFFEGNYIYDEKAEASTMPVEVVDVEKIKEDE